MSKCFPYEYLPAIFDPSCTRIELDGKTLQLELSDIAGYWEFDKMRPNTYPGKDVFVICFSIVDRESFEHVKTKWILEIIHHYGKDRIPPVILVGNKMDLRDDKTTLENLAEKKQTPVTKEEGIALAEKIGAELYLENSSLTMKGVNEVFPEVARVLLFPNNSKRKENCVLQ